jgi:hypothetical protein
MRSIEPGISRFSGAQLRTIVRTNARPGMTKESVAIKKACRHLRRQAFILVRSKSCARYATQRLQRSDGIGA